MCRFLFRICLASILVGVWQQALTQDHAIFNIVKQGDPRLLKTCLDTSQATVDLTNSQGYTPLHVLIESYVEARSEMEAKDSYKYSQAVSQQEQYRLCLDLLLNKGASATKLTPNKWTALQFAVMKGKWQPIEILLQRTKAGDVRDGAGNTLLHLSLLINPDEPIQQFWDNLIVHLRPFGITTSTTNLKGQTPLHFYLSQPRCNPPSARPAATGKLMGAATPAVPPKCQTSGTYEMLSHFWCEASIIAPDLSGKKAIEYAEIHNPWYASTLRMQAQAFAASAEIDQKYQRTIENNRRATEEYLIKMAEWEAEGAKLDLSFTKTYYSQCNSYQKNRIKLDEPVVISVTPDDISISSLTPYYGRFKIARSSYEVINGNQWAVYHLEQTSSNSTYKAIGFYENGCLIKSSYGEELICY
jgi:hypothetical protein